MTPYTHVCPILQYSYWMFAFLKRILGCQNMYCYQGLILRRELKITLHVRKRTWSLCLQTLPHNPVTGLDGEVYLHKPRRSLESTVIDYANLDPFQNICIQKTLAKLNSRHVACIVSATFSSLKTTNVLCLEDFTKKICHYL